MNKWTRESSEIVNGKRVATLTEYCDGEPDENGFTPATATYYIDNVEQFSMTLFIPPTKEDPFKEHNVAWSQVAQSGALCRQRWENMFSPKFLQRAKRPEDWDIIMAKIDEAHEKYMDALDEVISLSKN